MMTLETFTNEIKRGRKVIFLFGLGFLGFSLVYDIFLYKPMFVSESKVLLEEVAPITFITELGKGRNLETNSQEKNPILTQMEVLSSQDMAERVYHSLVQQHAIKVVPPGQEESFIQDIKGAIKLKTPPATDVIEVKVAWNTPSMSHLMNRTILEEYRKYNIEINRESNSQAKKYIQEQLERSRRELQKARNQIRDFKKANASVDLTTEAGSLVKEVQDTQDALFNIKSQINYHQRKVREYASKLHVRPNHVNVLLDSVALGQNGNLSGLYKDLNSVEQQYAALKVRYPDTTKKMIGLKESIKEVKTQIQSQVLSTLGPHSSKYGKILIQDSIRTQLVNDLINNQAEMFSLDAKQKVLKNQLQMLKTHLKKIPDIQATMAELIDRETNLASIVGALSSKLVEANVRESGILSNIDIVQRPTYPHSASFPSPMHILLLMALLGTSLGCFIVLARYYLLDIITDSAEMEEILGSPIIGELSFIPEKEFSDSGKEFRFRKQQSLEYERIVTMLKLKREDEAVSIIGFSGLTDSDTRSSVIASVGKILSSCNQSVMILDADFRHATVAQEFGLDARNLPDYNELLLSDAKWQHFVIKELVPVGNRSDSHEALALSGDSYIAQIDEYITQIEGENSLSIMTHGESFKSPYQLVSSKYMPMLIDQLKGRYDYILVDMSPALAFSDALILSRMLDGIIPICGLNTSRGKLKAVHKLFSEHQVKSLGAIVKLER